MSIDTFLGHPVSYWVTLKRHAEELNLTDVIIALAKAEAKVAFYERHFSTVNEQLAAMNKFYEKPLR